jgi:hypothetical protein
MAGLAFIYQLAGVVNLRVSKLDLSAKLYASALRCLHSGAGAL